MPGGAAGKRPRRLRRAGSKRFLSLLDEAGASHQSIDEPFCAASGEQAPSAPPPRHRPVSGLTLATSASAEAVRSPGRARVAPCPQDAAAAVHTRHVTIVSMLRVIAASHLLARAQVRRLQGWLPYQAHLHPPPHLLALLPPRRASPAGSQRRARWGASSSAMLARFSGVARRSARSARRWSTQSRLAGPRPHSSAAAPPAGPPRRCAWRHDALALLLIISARSREIRVMPEARRSALPRAGAGEEPIRAGGGVGGRARSQPVWPRRRPPVLGCADWRRRGLGRGGGGAAHAHHARREQASRRIALWCVTRPSCPPRCLQRDRALRQSPNTPLGSRAFSFF